MRRIGVFLLAGWIISVCTARKLALREGNSGESDDQKAKLGEEEIVTRPGDDVPNFDNPPDEELPSILKLNGPNQNNGKNTSDTAGGAENVEESSKKHNFKDFQPFPTRPVKSGDTFTPYELLPITQRLISKVDRPGKGKGIVSSEKNPFALADVLFDAFFLGPKRIVILQDSDIPGLDALQALAQSGDEILRTPEHVTEPAYTLKEHENQIIAVHNSPRVSKYTLLSKPRKNYKNIRRTGKTKKSKMKKSLKLQKRKSVLRNRSSKLAKKLGKNRNLIINPARKRNTNNKTIAVNAPAKVVRQFPKKRIARKKLVNPNKMKKRHPVKSHKRNTKQSHFVDHASPRPIAVKSLYPNKKKLSCRWRYACANQGDLDSCRLRTHCTRRDLPGTTPNYIGPVETADREAALRKFRRMVNIYPVDEEVEKILEVRIMKLRPNTINPYRDRIESLSEYFNKIIVGEMMKTTPAGIQKLESTSPGMHDLESDESTTFAPENEESTALESQNTASMDVTEPGLSLTGAMNTEQYKRLLRT